MTSLLKHIGWDQSYTRSHHNQRRRLESSRVWSTLITCTGLKIGDVGAISLAIRDADMLSRRSRVS